MRRSVVAFTPDFVKIAGFQTFLYTQLKLLRHTPILIYTRSKVGSTSVLIGAREHFPLVLQYHNLLPKAVQSNIEARSDLMGRYNSWHALWMYHQVIEKKRPVKIISLVREPVAHALSHFFHNLDTIMATPNAHKHSTMEALQKAFITEHLPRMGRFNWFKEEMLPAIGINVYEYPFIPEEGHQQISVDNIDLLLLKTEISSEAKENALASFLNLPSFKIRRANEGSEKDYGTAYADFKKQFVLPRSLLETIYSEPYAKHFYSDAERAGFINKWTSQAVVPSTIAKN